MKTKLFMHQRTLVLAVAGMLVALAIAATAAGHGAGGGGAGTFSAIFEARAAASPQTTSCRSLPAVQRIEGRYAGLFTVRADAPTEPDPPSESDLPAALELNFSLEALYDRAADAGTAEGQWQLVDPTTRSVVGSGELAAAVVKAPDLEPPDPDLEPPDPDLEPPDPDLELHGLLIGALEPPDPDLPAQRLVANFTGAITEGTLNFTGAIGDATGLSWNPAVLLPAVKC